MPLVVAPDDLAGRTLDQHRVLEAAARKRDGVPAGAFGDFHDRLDQRVVKAGRDRAGPRTAEIVERGRKQQDILLKREMDLSGWGRLESLFGREAGDELRYECRREHHEI